MVRPKGSPAPREKKSQDAQIKSGYYPGEEKGLKRPMSSKDGLEQHSAPSHSTQPVRGRDIIGSIQQILDTDKNLAGHKLTVHRANNQVEVTGIVDTLAEKNYMQRILQKSGVGKFVDSVSISTDGQVLDSHVILEVREELDAVPELRDSHIDLHIHKGTVFLEGTVSGRRDQQAAVVATQKARGVTRVVSNLDYVETDLSLEELFHSQVNNDREERPPH
jgi:hyperosmotically inducible protein